MFCFVLIAMVLFSVCNRIIIKHKTAANANGLSSIVFIFQIQISNWFSSIILNWKLFIAKVRIMYSINFVSFQVVNFIFNRYVFEFSSSFFSPLPQMKINGRVCHDSCDPNGVITLPINWISSCWMFILLWIVNAFTCTQRTKHENPFETIRKFSCWLHFNQCGWESAVSVKLKIKLD